MEIMQCGSSPHVVTLNVVETQTGDIWAGLFGGEKSHVGAVVLAVPSIDIHGEGVTCDISQICAPSHKDVYAAVDVAQMLEKATGRTVSVTAGLHIENASEDDIALLMENARACARKWVERHQAQ